MAFLKRYLRNLVLAFFIIAMILAVISIAIGIMYLSVTIHWSIAVVALIMLITLIFTLNDEDYFYNG